MKHINGCILVVFFCSMFLLQIWVAQAQTEKKSKLEGGDPKVIQALHIIINKSAVKKQYFPSLEESDKNSITKASVKGVKKVKTQKEDDKELVWYKPWTWFK